MTIRFLMMQIPHGKRPGLRRSTESFLKGTGGRLRKPADCGRVKDIQTQEGIRNMDQQTLGRMIASLRKEQGMTQLELAERMGVTDKAVSKWERDLSCPSVDALPRLAELFGVSVDTLMQVKPQTPPAGKHTPRREITALTLRAVALAMGVAVAVLSVLKQIDLYSGFAMLGIGLACTGLALFCKGDGESGTGAP